MIQPPTGIFRPEDRPRPRLAMWPGCLSLMSVSVQPELDVAPASGVADVRLQNVSKAFGDVIAVDDLTLTIRRGEFFSLLGPSGCGKTTTLGMIGGFERPTSGEIFLGGAKRQQGRRLQARRQHGLPVLRALSPP